MDCTDDWPQNGFNVYRLLTCPCPKDLISDDVRNALCEMCVKVLLSPLLEIEDRNVADEADTNCEHP